MVVPMVPMAAEVGAAQVGFPGLEVTDSSYGGSYGSYGRQGRRCPGRVFPAWKLQMVPMVSHVFYGCPIR